MHPSWDQSLVNDKENASKPKTKSASQSEGTASSKIERKKSRSKATDKDMELKNAEIEENTVKSVNENKSDYKTTCYIEFEPDS